MPQSLVKKVADKCNMDTGEVEDIWKKAKEKAADQGHEEDWGYITSIFKSMVPSDCKDKMNWNKNKKEEFDMSNTDQILNRITQILGEELSEEGNGIDWDSVWEALVKTAQDVFGDDYDEDKVKEVFNAVKKKDPKDEEDAVAIGQAMLREEE